MATSAELDQLIERVREAARSRLLHDSELAAYHHTANDPVQQAHSEIQAELLDPATKDTPATTARIEAEAIRMLRETAASNDDPAMRDEARRALIRLNVSVEDPNIKKAAEARERDRDRDRWADEVWHSFNGSGAKTATATLTKRDTVPAPSGAALFAAEEAARRARIVELAKDASPELRASALAVLNKTTTSRRPVR